MKKDVFTPCSKHRAHDGDGGGHPLPLGALGAALEGDCPRWQYAKPALAGATKQAHEEGLGAIVGVVSRRDGGIAATRHGDECFPASLASSCLQVSPSRNVDACAIEADAELRSERGREIELPRRLGAKAMIHAMREDRQSELGPDAGEHREEGHRIGAAANGDEERRRLWESALPSQRAPDDRRERCRLRDLRDLERECARAHAEGLARPEHLCVRQGVQAKTA